MRRRPRGINLGQILIAMIGFFVLIILVSFGLDAIAVADDQKKLIEVLTSAKVSIATPDAPNLPTTITTDPKYDRLMRAYRPSGYLSHKLGEVYASQFAFSQRLDDGSWQAEIPATAGIELLLSVDWPSAAKPRETLDFLVYAPPIIDGLPRYRLWYGGSSASQPAGTE